MKFLLVNLIGTEDDFSLKLDKPTDGASQDKPKEKVTIEDHDVTSEIPRTGERQVTISADVLAILVENAKNGGKKNSDGDALAAAIAKLAEATNESNDTMDRRFLGARPIASYEIDKDDLLENPVVFFAHSVSFAIYDDKKNSFTIHSPYKRQFKFKTIQRVVDKSSARNPNYMTLSAITIRSKKEAEWLRKHTLFGIKFFEQREGGKDISLDLQDKIVKAWNIVSAIDDHSVMQRCIGEGISIDTPDNSTLRRKLAFKIASNMSKDEERIRRNPVTDYENVVMSRVPVEGETKQQTVGSTY